MHPAATIAAAIVGAAAASFAVVQYAPPTAPPPASSPTADLAPLQQQIDELRTELQALRRPAVADAAAAPAGRTVVPQADPEQVAAAVERYLAQRDGKQASGATAAEVDVTAVRDQLHGHANYWNNGDLYKRIHAAGKMDELVSQFEQLAAASPNDPQAQMDLANAYLAYLQLDNTKWQLSMKADAQFDKVLELNDNHWEARFSKAVSYTFWPEFLGKRQAAISNFERLPRQPAVAARARAGARDLAARPAPPPGQRRAAGQAEPVATGARSAGGGPARQWRPGAHARPGKRPGRTYPVRPSPEASP